MKTVQRWGKSLLLVFVVVFLTACGKQPPDCSDSASAATLRGMLNDKIVEALSSRGTDVKQDTRGVIPKFLETWNFALTNVSTTGYDKTSRIRSCKAKATVALPDSKQKGEVEIEYTLQVFDDSKSGEFQLQVSKNFVTWAYGHYGLVQNYYNIHRVQGTWAGTSQCSPSALRDSYRPEVLAQGVTVLKTHEPWAADDVNSRPVVLDVKDGVVTMTISKPDGSKVIRKGNIDPSQQFASSSFRFADKDELSTIVPQSGYFQGDEFREVETDQSVPVEIKFNATGGTADTFLVRRCALTLAKK